MGAGCRAVGLLLLLGACASDPPPPAPAATGRLSAVVIGRSTRRDVVAALGRPSRIERSRSAESWVYEHDGGHARSSGMMGGVAAASSVAGAFVPFVGLIGPGLGLAKSVGGSGPSAVSSETIQFGEDGLVRDCLLTSTTLPANLDAPPADQCTR